MTPRATFAGLVEAILTRFFQQNGWPPPAAEDRAGIADRLWSLIEERGLPRPLAAAERGEPGEMSDVEVKPLLERVLTPELESRDQLKGPVKQLVKACFYPEFKTCRDSFQELEPDGTCRRQQLARTQLRISGAHCVDCPHWVALSPAQHEKYLRRCWRPEGWADLTAHQDVFLPEDFRALRVFLYQQARAAA